MTMRVNLVDWSLKLSKLAELAGVSALNSSDVKSLAREVVFHFEPKFVRNQDVADDKSAQYDAPKSIVLILSNPEKNQVELTKKDGSSSPLLDWTNTVISKIGFPDDAKKFYDGKLDETPWAQFNQNITLGDGRENDSRSSNSDLLPIIFFDPQSHVGMPQVPWDAHGVVDQRYMYTDRQAAAQWAGIRGRETYGLYEVCKSLVKQSAKKIQEHSSNIEQLILLGAGSPDKDWEIIFQIASSNSNDRLEVYICDASFYMLMETKQELEKSIIANKKFIDKEKIKIILSCFDFTKPSSWKACSFDRKKTTVFAVLGGTVGNVIESGFLDCLRLKSKPNDFLIIAGNFYESSEDVRERGRKHVDEQYGDDAKALALNSVSSILDSSNRTRSFSQKLELVKIGYEDATELPSQISSRIPSTMSAVFYIPTTKISSEIEHLDSIDRVYLLTSKRYVRPHFIDYVTSRKQMPLELLGEIESELSKFPYFHFVFRFADRPNAEAT
jgi:hypothetical protein